MRGPDSRVQGLDSLRLDRRGIFDVDVHEIPPRGSEPAHLHYDVRFLCRANRAEAPVASDESRDARWLTLEDARRLAPEESIERMIRKTGGMLA